MVSNNTPSNDNKQSIASLKDSAKYIAGAIILALIGYFGWNYYQSKVSSVDTQAADSYIDIQQRIIDIQATAQNPNLDDVAKLELESNLNALDEDINQLVTNHGDTIYAWQALMFQARQLSDQGEYEQAAQTFKQIMMIDVQDAGLEAISHLRYASALLGAQDLNGALLAASVEVPMAFEATKQELLGDIYSEQGDKDKAQRAYNNAWAILQKRQEERTILKLKMEKMGMTPEPIEPKPSVKSVPVIDQQQALTELQQEAMSMQQSTDEMSEQDSSVQDTDEDDVGKKSDDSDAIQKDDAVSEK